MMKPGQWRVCLLALTTFAISVTVVVVSAEVMIRLFVPKEAFWLVSNI